VDGRNMPEDTGHSSSSTVFSVKPAKFGRIFALASVDTDIEGLLHVIHGIHQRAITANRS
jgi:hypothetical protein